jgi:acetyl-CoA synthetase
MDGPEVEDCRGEARGFPRSEKTKSEALVSDSSLYEAAERDRMAFWAEQARSLSWFERWETVLEWHRPFAKWFVGGKLNVAYNCLDRHVEAGRGDRVAYHFEGEPGDRRTMTYAQLLDEVGRCANALHSLGVERGDRVAIYMPMILELPVAMLACARVGAVHAVVSDRVSADGLRDRIEDAGARVLVTADGGWRRGQPVRLKTSVDLALAGGAGSIEHVIVVRRLGDAVDDVVMADGRDLWWHDVVESQETHSAPETMDSEDLLYLLYTRDTTQKPKPIMHTSGGYLTQVAFTYKYVFDHVLARDVYWCTTDVGLAAVHGYVVYGPLANGATSILYEGAPDHPGGDRWWSIIERYGVTVLYTAATAIRTFMRWGTGLPAAHDLTSLRILGSVGEPINTETRIWYYEHIGGGRCPVLDTWWQAETGAIMMASLPGVTMLEPASTTVPLPGISAEVVDESGRPIRLIAGYLVLPEPWPAMLRGIYGDRERYRETYWSRFAGSYFAGDRAERDEEGYFWLLGRADDTQP